MAPPAQAKHSGPVWDAAVPSDVDDADLAVVALVVLLEEPVQRDRRGRPVVEVTEREELVGDVGVGLGRDGADTGHGRRDGRADGEELGGHGDAPRLAVVGAGHDRERHGADPSGARRDPLHTTGGHR